MNKELRFGLVVFMVLMLNIYALDIITYLDSGYYYILFFLDAMLFIILLFATFG